MVCEIKHLPGCVVSCSDGQVSDRLTANIKTYGKKLEGRPYLSLDELKYSPDPRTCHENTDYLPASQGAGELYSTYMGCQCFEGKLHSHGKMWVLNMVLDLI